MATLLLLSYQLWGFISVGKAYKDHDSNYAVKLFLNVAFKKFYLSGSFKKQNPP